VSRFDLIVRGGAVVFEHGVENADVGIEGETIADVGPDLSGTARSEIDARGLHVLPGAIDAHVHFNEPGRGSWEGWSTGSAACAAGGTTAVAEMPLNAHPPTLDGAAFDAKHAAASAQSHVDFALWGGLTPGNLNCMGELAQRGVIGFKAFMSNSGIDDFPAADDATLYEGMRRATALHLPVAIHAENDAITAHLARRAVADGRTAARDYHASRPAIAEIEAISRALLLAEETGCALHVVHVSTGRGVSRIAEARARGIDVSAETCPHYLLFDEDDLARLGAVAKCAPPLRPSTDVAALWHAVERGDFQLIASDHSPAPAEMKTGENVFQIWGGISGCQSMLAAIISTGHVAYGLPLPLLARLLATGPANRLRLAGKGSIAPGHDADLVLVDLDGNFTLTADDLRYRHRHSPYVGMTFRASPVRTILRGETIAIGGETVGLPRGRLLTPAVSAQV
jgi:allantoinase